MRTAGPLIGILGGMGPLATAAFMTELVTLTDAACDQDHFRSLVYCNPRIPDRSRAILDAGPSPLPDLLEGIGVLARCGADVIAIPCNSAHFWFGELSASTDVPILSIIEAVAQELERQGYAATRIGLFATLGLTQSAIYQRGLAAFGFDVVTLPAAESAQLVEPAIRAIKAGRLGSALSSLRLAIEVMRGLGVSAIVLGCTELPLAVEGLPEAGVMPLIDSTRALARACIGWAGRHASGETILPQRAPGFLAGSSAQDGCPAMPLSHPLPAGMDL